MMRGAREWALGLALASIACNEGHKKMGTPPNEPSSKSPSSPWTEVAIRGVELFVEHDPAPPHRARASARLDGSGAVLRGKAAFDATRPRAGTDATALAALAMLFLDDNVAGKLPWTKPGPQVPEQQAIAAPPSLAGDVLTYWRPHPQLADLVRCQLTLTTGELRCELGGDVVQRERVGANPADAAKQYLSSDNVYERIRGIQALGAVEDAAATKQLIDLALNAHDFRERQAAVEVLGKTGGDGVVAAVSRVLLFDQYVEVRQAAATALGALRDPAAREALTKASTGDANGRVQVLAADALKQLK